jgi:hypothetical protein
MPMQFCLQSYKKNNDLFSKSDYPKYFLLNSEGITVYPLASIEICKVNKQKYRHPL